MNIIIYFTFFVKKSLSCRFWLVPKSEFVEQEPQTEQVRNPQEIISENVFFGKGMPDSAPLQDLRKTK